MFWVAVLETVLHESDVVWPYVITEENVINKMIISPK